MYKYKEIYLVIKFSETGHTNLEYGPKVVPKLTKKIVLTKNEKIPPKTIKIHKNKICTYMIIKI
jgi:hypothetical protein